MLKLYLGSVDIFNNTDIYNRAFNRASLERKEKVKRFKFEKDKKLSLLAECLIQKAMEDLDIQSNIVYSDGGKPYFRDNSDFYISISHSDKKAMVAVATVPIGCDLEKISDVNMGIVKRFFSPLESDYITEVKSLQAERFFRIWTLKESFIKLTGEGMTQFSATEVVITGDKTSIMFDKKLQNVVTYNFILEGYSIAVCCKETKPVQPQIICVTKEDLKI